MFDDRRHDGRRSALAARLKWMRPFHHAPAVVGALKRQLDHFPNVLAYVADPGLTGFRIERESPWIAKAVSPDLGERAWGIHKWIVFRDRVISPRIRMVHVEPHHDGL